MEEKPIAILLSFYNTNSWFEHEQHYDRICMDWEQGGLE
jgi:hypothetical protein